MADTKGIPPTMERLMRSEHPLVFIVDPDQPSMQLLRGIYTHEGYQVHTIGDPHRVLPEALSMVPDLIVIELRLGTLNGLEIISLLKETPQTSDIPTFLLTTQFDWQDLLSGTHLRADDYIRKPLQPRELLARSEAKIRSRRLERALQRRTSDLETLLRLSESLKGTQQVDEVLKVVLPLMHSLLPSNVSIAVIAEQAAPEPTYLRAIPEDKSPHIRHMAANALTHAETVTTMVDIQRLHDQSASEGAHDLIVGTMRYGGDAGALACLCFQTRVMPDAMHMQLFEGLIRQTALALQTAELYRRQANHAQELELEVEARTQELRSAQDQLVRTEKLAMIGRLTAGIAHEINNPLLPIKLNLESVLEDLEDGLTADPDLIAATLISVERIQDLVKRLLEFNSSRSAEITETVDLAQSVKMTADFVRRVFDRQQQNLKLDVSQVPLIQGSEAALSQVFINLALNASEAMTTGGTLEIGVRAEKQGVTVWFADTGPGLDEAMLPTLFEPFHTNKPSGNGLGLFITYGIVESHGGRISVANRSAGGAVFTLWFPAAKLGEGSRR
jgi:signal transduction histidine kinase